jgi:hypothetical protein
LQSSSSSLRFLLELQTLPFFLSLNIVLVHTNSDVKKVGKNVPTDENKSRRKENDCLVTRLMKKTIVLHVNVAW